MSLITECQDARPLTPAEFELAPPDLRDMLCSASARLGLAREVGDRYNEGRAAGIIAALNILVRHELRMAAVQAGPTEVLRPRRGLRAWLADLRRIRAYASGH